MDMTNEPPVWFDSCIGSKREGCVAYPKFSKVDNSYIERFKEASLMLPSERLDDHKAIKAGTEQWRQARRELFEHNKRKRILERKHKGGIIGIDYPLRENTELYKHDFDRYKEQRDAKETHLEGRREFLGDHKRGSECITEPYGCAPAADRGSTDYGFFMDRKTIDRERHPARFLDTHQRLWPKFTPVWDNKRATCLRFHDVRHKSYNIITGADNTMDIKVRTS